MPVGTQGTIKGIFNDDIKNKNTNYIRKYLSFITKTWNRNTRKINDYIFMNWDKPILTDSGGYQIMSLSKLNKIDLKIGAIFKSHLDGKK